MTIQSFANLIREEKKSLLGRVFFCYFHALEAVGCVFFPEIWRPKVEFCGHFNGLSRGLEGRLWSGDEQAKVTRVARGTVNYIWH